MTKTAKPKRNVGAEDIVLAVRTAVEDALADPIEKLGKIGEIRGDIARITADLTRWTDRTAELVDRMSDLRRQDMAVLADRLRDIESIIRPLSRLLESMPAAADLGAKIAGALEPISRIITEIAEAAATRHAEELRLARSHHVELVARLDATAETDTLRHQQLTKTLDGFDAEMAQTADFRREVRQTLSELPRPRWAELRAVTKALAGVKLTPTTGLMTPRTDPARFITAKVKLGDGITVARTAAGSFQVLVGEFFVSRVEGRWYPAILSEVADCALAAAAPVFAASKMGSCKPTGTGAGHRRVVAQAASDVPKTKSGSGFPEFLRRPSPGGREADHG